jgi:hypothetical protein
VGMKLHDGSTHQNTLCEESTAYRMEHHHQSCYGCTTFPPPSLALSCSQRFGLILGSSWREGVWLESCTQPACLLRSRS